MYKISSLEGKLILFAVILASGMAFLDGTVVNIALPVIEAKFKTNIFGIQWIVNAYALMLSSLILISGSLGDNFGRKKIFIYGIAVFILASFMCGVSSSISQLIIFRGLQGIGGAMMVPGSLSIINSSFEHSTRGRAIGLWSGFSGGIAALGPFLGGWLVQTFGWASIFFINIPLGLLALFIAFKFIPESKNIAAKRIDYFGSLLVFLGLLGITYGLIEGPNIGWNNPLALFPLMFGLLLFITFILTSVKKPYSLIPFNIFKSNLVVGANIVTLFLYFALSGVIFFLVLNLQQVQHLTPLQAGLGLLPTILIITFLSGRGGSIADKFGPRLPMIFGPLTVSVGMFLLALSGRNANYFTQIMPGLILFGLGMAFVIAPLTKSALSVEEKYSGAASGVNNAVARIAGLLAVALLGAICLFLFTLKLDSSIRASRLNQTEKKQILEQKDKLAGIEIPRSFSPDAKVLAKNEIEDSFVYSFRYVMGINAFLAFLSATVAYFIIPPTGKKSF